MLATLVNYWSYKCSNYSDNEKASLVWKVHLQYLGKLRIRLNSVRIKLGNGRNPVSRVLSRRRELTEFCGKLGEFCEKLGEFALAHK